MKRIEDFKDTIENLSKDEGVGLSVLFKNFNFYYGALHAHFIENSEVNYYVLKLEGNDILGYSLFFSGIGFDVGQRNPEEKDAKTMESIIGLNEKISEKLSFNNLVVRLKDDFTKEICKKRGYEFEKENDYQIAVKKIPSRDERINKHFEEDVPDFG